MATLRWLKSSFGRSYLLLLPLLAFISITGCSSLSPLGSLAGSGTNVAANTQIGKTNTQTVGQTNNIAPTVSLRPNARVDTVDQSNNNTTNNELPLSVWIIGGLLFIIGWVTDTPHTYIRRLRGKRDP